MKGINFFLNLFFNPKVVINMEGNQLTELPQDIGRWTCLRGANLARNKLTRFPEGLFDCHNLALLDLSGNLISEIDVSSLTSIQTKMS